MHNLDLAIIISLGFAALGGAWLGFCRQIVRMTIYVVAASATAQWYPFAAKLVLQFAGDKLPAGSRELTADVAGVLITFLALYAAIALAMRIVRGVAKRLLFPSGANTEEPTSSLFPKLADRLAGAALAMTITGALIGGGLALMSAVAVPQIEEKLAGSKLRQPFVDGAQAVAAIVPQQYKDEFTAALKRLQERSKSAGGTLLGQGLQSMTKEVNQLADRMDDPQAQKQLESTLRQLLPQK